ncbi:MAG: transglycosylase domain-containing protein [Butyrivibrio sp.]|nr:transglycosylase domain-containing protein [Butyrivibrio sp.]
MDYSKRGIRKQRQRLTASTEKWTNKLGLLVVMVLLFSFIGLFIIGGCAGLGIFRGVIDTAPDIKGIDVTPTGFSTFVYDTDGNQIAKLVSTDSNRIPVSWDMIPENLAHAFVAIEDERFYEHNGIDIHGIIRAGFVAVTTRDLSQGASTITQQLLKNNVFTGWTEESNDVERIKRKIQEQYLAIQLEKNMSKEDILLNYLNTINLGSNTLGVQAASLRYFNKSVSTLTLSECAVIAAITQRPTYYNPILHPDHNEERRAKVLRKMLEQGYIEKIEYERALEDDVYARIGIVEEESTESSINSYFVDALTNDVLEDLTELGYNETQAYTLLYSGGLKIYSTQDPAIQRIADQEFTNEANYPDGTKYLLSYELTTEDAAGSRHNYSKEMLKEYFLQSNSHFDLLFNSQEDAQAAVDEYRASVMSDGDEVVGENITLTPQPQVSLTVEDPHTGYVLAMVGGRGSKTASRTFNRATDMTRQPGSTFKILAAYAPAFDSAGLTLATVLNDGPFTYYDGRPVRNWYGEAYRGLTDLRQGIAQSMNILAVKTITLVTPQLAYDYLRNFGFTTIVESETIGGKIFTDVQQTAALGGLTYGVTNKELNGAFSSIANGGVYVEPRLYTKIVDHDGNVVIDNSMPNSRRILKETTAFLLTSAMESVVQGGTGSRVNFGTTAIAGKTGSTTGYNDVWFAGFTNYFCATVWAGYDNNVDMKSSDERHLAQTLWRAVMSRIHEGLPSSGFEKPAKIVQATVCSRSGLLPIEGLCDGCRKTEYFEEGTVPTESCNIHFAGSICELDHLPASESCPFQAGGVFELPYQEPAALQPYCGNDGSTGAYTTTTDEQGNPITVQNQCHHTPAFMAQENIGEILHQELVAAGIDPPDPAPEEAQPEGGAAPAEGQPPAELPDGE